jgi:HopA1 effector protein family
MACTVVANQDAPADVKVCLLPDVQGRADAVVVYSPRWLMSVISAELVEACVSHMRGGPPALTREIAPGVGVALDPGPSAISYGMLLCDTAAEALAAASTRAKLVRAWSAACRQRSINPLAPWMGTQA